MRKTRSALLASTLLFVGTAAVHAQIQLSDFESGEGYTAGQTINSQGGWSGSPAADFYVIDTSAASGTQSLRVRAATTGRLDSPVWLEHDLVGLSLKIKNDGVAYAASRVFSRIRILLGDEVGGTVTAQRVLQFQLQYHSSSTTSYTLSYYDWVEGASVSKTANFSTALLPEGGWGDFRFEADMEAKTYSLWLGSTQILSGVNIGGDGLTGDSRITQLQFWGNSVAGTGYTLYDQIVGLKAIPEPGSVALLGSALLIGAGLYGRQMR